MGYERQCFLNAHPYQRTEEPVDQANRFYERSFTTRLAPMELRGAVCFRPVGTVGQLSG